jgi:HD-GYP domain-containing protein (c-di-GMP phosphodiesterase class II)
MGDPLPFDVFDNNGMLLLPARGVIRDESKLLLLRSKSLFIDEDASARWRASFTSSVHKLIHTNASLRHIAAGNIHRDRVASNVQAEVLGTVETWTQLMRSLHQALRHPAGGSGWLEQVTQALARARELSRRKPHAALFLLFQHAAHSAEAYSAQHGMLCAMVCERVGQVLELGETELNSLCHAAVTMNVGMTALQDTLAQQRLPLNAEQRERIAQHPLIGSTMLAQSGVDDGRWLKIVRLHHDAQLLERPLRELDMASRLARLLNVVDRFTAKLSRRGNRAPMSPLSAARGACVGADGQPDEYGSALLKALGMYPPGCYVQLSTGEVAVVMAPGRRANEPLVAAIVGRGGLALSEPVLRDTSLAGRQVVAPVAPAEVRVRLNQQRLLDLM